MMSLTYLKWFPFIGYNWHEAMPTPIPPIVFPMPHLSFGVVNGFTSLFSWPSDAEGKEVTHQGMPFVGFTNDAMPLVPHITLPIIWNPLLPFCILFGGSTAVIASENTRVKCANPIFGDEAQAMACTLLGPVPIGVSLSCGEPWTYPFDFPILWSTVAVDLTWSDILNGLVELATAWAMEGLTLTLGQLVKRVPRWKSGAAEETETLLTRGALKKIKADDAAVATGNLVDDSRTVANSVRKQIIKVRTEGKADWKATQKKINDKKAEIQKKELKAHDLGRSDNSAQMLKRHEKQLEEVRDSIKNLETELDKLIKKQATDEKHNLMRVRHKLAPDILDSVKETKPDPGSLADISSSMIQKERWKKARTDAYAEESGGFYNLNLNTKADDNLKEYLKDGVVLKGGAGKLKLTDWQLKWAKIEGSDFAKHVKGDGALDALDYVRRARFGDFSETKKIFPNFDWSKASYSTRTQWAMMGAAEAILKDGIFGVAFGKKFSKAMHIKIWGTAAKTGDFLELKTKFQAKRDKLKKLLPEFAQGGGKSITIKSEWDDELKRDLWDDVYHYIGDVGDTLAPTFEAVGERIASGGKR